MRLGEIRHTEVVSRLDVADVRHPEIMAHLEKNTTFHTEISTKLDRSTTQQTDVIESVARIHETIKENVSLIETVQFVFYLLIAPYVRLGHSPYSKFYPL